jgi:hypothetical protein
MRTLAIKPLYQMANFEKLIEINIGVLGASHSLAYNPSSPGKARRRVSWRALSWSTPSDENPLGTGRSALNGSQTVQVIRRA